MYFKTAVLALVAAGTGVAAEPASATLLQTKHLLWDRLLVASAVAVAGSGEWGWAELLKSPEMESSLLATLAAGQSGAPEKVERDVAKKIWRASRPDGVLIRPDSPLAPTPAAAAAVVGRSEEPMVAWAYTDDEAQRTAYLFSYDRSDSLAQTSFAPSDLGFSGQIMVLNRGTGSAWRQPAEDPCLIMIEPEGYAYLEVAPVRPNGLVFFGDQGKFVSNGRQRIAGITSVTGGVLVSVDFAAGEPPISLFGYSRSVPVAKALTGSVGKVGFNAANGRYTVLVTPPAGKAEEVRRAQVEIILPTAVFTAPIKD